MHQMKAIEAAREVREKLLKLSGVIGIGHGWKRRAGRKTGTYAVVVYVREKRALATIPRGERIPRRVGGVATDVVAHGTGHGRLEDEHAHRFRDHLKVHREHVKATGGPRRPSSAHDVDIGQIAVIEDDPHRTFRMAGDDVDWIGAYRKFRLTHPDIYDFVTFWSDFPVECDCGAFYCGLANPARGINGRPVWQRAGAAGAPGASRHSTISSGRTTPPSCKKWGTTGGPMRASRPHPGTDKCASTIVWGMNRDTGAAISMTTGPPWTMTSRS